MIEGAWENVVISGWILDPDRKKMSKSKGNVITPVDTIEEYGADAVRYWAASARLGTDTTYDENVFLVGSSKISSATIHFAVPRTNRKRPQNLILSASCTEL